jgi:hypothetical protein
MSEKERPQSGPNEAAFVAKVAWHRRQARLPITEKVHILLELQRRDYELLKRHHALKSWERPWEIDP